MEMTEITEQEVALKKKKQEQALEHRKGASD